ncbi:MAG: 3-hydroxybutyryl-CoA dehydrogenase [Flammeovirgaceae bacterium]|nr:3-hydroxybutyryl-CoA dehydrogenase [Flammeovirgaceae bacterium]MDW8287967.1 3-hydroxybutyryl-CoA dehydrogenase [Flammeovirgaceae bacterium]
MKNIAVIGSGTMGNGIAHVFAQHGYKVSLVDISETALQKALKTIEQNLHRQAKKGVIAEGDIPTILQNMKTYTNLAHGVKEADLAVEAATENIEVKLNIFRDLDTWCRPDTILATNTSSISITKIASVTKRPDKVIGMHFMNPVPMMKLVEVINGYLTSHETSQTIVSLAEKIGKTPITANDYPGFVSNRILMPMINEAIYALFTGVAGVAEIDAIMKLGMAHPMGPLQLADFIGLDVCLAIMKVLQEGLGDDKYAPCPLLVNMVTAGHLGKKTGIGFYRYDTDSKDLVVAPQFNRQ